MTQNPSWAVVAQQALDKSSKTPTGPVTSKVEKRRWGFTCEHCEWVWLPPVDKTHLMAYAESEYYNEKDLLADGYEKFIHKRCKKHRAAAKKWNRAGKTFIQLDELRMNEGIEHLRFVTKTHPKWTKLVPFEQCGDLASIMDAHKTKCLKHWRNWRYQNKWWISRNALGRYWPECVQKIIWKGYAPAGIQLHFHTHSIIVSKYLDNKPTLGVMEIDGVGVDYQEDSRFKEEWGGIVDVRAVKDYQREYIVKGETRKGCGRRACMNYLTKYITKAAHWKSCKIGKW